MSINAFPYIVSWVVLACIVVALAAYKAAVYVRAVKDEFPPHLVEVSNTQAARISATMHLEEAIERWGKILTIVTVAYGLVLAIIWLYQVLNTVPQA